MPLIIDFEGITGSGKTTLIRLLAKDFKKVGTKPFLFREPGSTHLANKIKETLFSEKPSPLAELFLFLASRAELWQKISLIKKSKTGVLIILERSAPATFAYQYYARGLNKIINEKELGILNKLAMFENKIDLIILLDVNSKVALKRARRRNYFEKEPISFHNKVRRGYLLQAKKNKNWLVFNSAKPVAVLKEEIKKTVFKKLGMRN